jgi:hypothetical protein
VQTDFFSQLRRKGQSELTYSAGRGAEQAVFKRLAVGDYLYIMHL